VCSFADYQLTSGREHSMAELESLADAVLRHWGGFLELQRSARIVEAYRALASHAAGMPEASRVQTILREASALQWLPAASEDVARCARRAKVMLMPYQRELLPLTLVAVTLALSRDAASKADSQLAQVRAPAPVHPALCLLIPCAHFATASLHHCATASLHHCSTAPLHNCSLHSADSCAPSTAPPRLHTALPPAWSFAAWRASCPSCPLRPAAAETRWAGCRKRRNAKPPLCSLHTCSTQSRGSTLCPSQLCASSPRRPSCGFVAWSGALQVVRARMMWAAWQHNMKYAQQCFHASAYVCCKIFWFQCAGAPCCNRHF
jgi:hypothetical protein